MMLSLLALPLAYLAATVAGYADPLACSGTCTNAHDPSLIRRSSDGTYFRFATGSGVPIHTADSIQGPWTYKGYVLAGGSSIDNSGADDMWAPDVHLIGSTYYLYYAVSSFGTQDSVIGLATSTTMDVGSWTDHGSVGISSSSGKSYNAIDPNLFAVSDTEYYLQFGSFWHDIYQIEMKSTPTTVLNGASSVNLAYNATGSHSLEGSYLVYRNNYYYLFFSSGKCCGYDTDRPAAGEEYKIMVCRSSSINGNYVDESGASCLSSGGTEVLASHGNVYGPGGQGVYEDPELGWVIYYHYVDTTVGYADGDKLLGVNKITWTNGWPTV